MGVDRQVAAVQSRSPSSSTGTSALIVIVMVVFAVSFFQVLLVEASVV